MGRYWIAIACLLGWFVPGAALAQAALNPDWVVQVTRAPRAQSPSAHSRASAEGELLRLVAAEQEHHGRTGRFTGRLSELTAYTADPTVRMTVTASAEWLVVLGVGEDGDAVQVAVWRRTAVVESGEALAPGDSALR